MVDISEIQQRALSELREAGTLEELDRAYARYLGRKGELTQQLRQLGELPEEKRAETGKALNAAKEALQQVYTERRSELEDYELRNREEQEWVDVTAPAEQPLMGHLHPLTQVMREIEDIFRTMGFAVATGPEVETAWYNFDALNIPPEHPARDLWDTFWLERTKHKTQSPKKDNESGMLLRTHTSPVQVRYMEQHTPPFRIVAPGRCFRHEATDASHEAQFYQVEGLMVGGRGEVTAAHFRGVIEEFLWGFFGAERETRLRTSYFPFTEPSFEVDIKCANCSGEGCSTCEHSGFVEMMGAGMVHPRVFEAVGYVPDNWQGFAFGMSIDRLAMMKYNIDDIRLFHSGDLRFLTQF